MFPHQKLDWHLRRLEKLLKSSPDDAEARLELGALELSKAWFHDGGESWFNKALHNGKHVLSNHRNDQRGLVLVGTSYIGIGRLDHAEKYLDEAMQLAADSAPLRMAMGWLHSERGESKAATREFLLACQLTNNEAWEPHAMVTETLWREAHQQDHDRVTLAACRRHAIEALRHTLPDRWRASLKYRLALANLHLGRLNDAERQLKGLIDDRKYKTYALYYCGLAFLENGKYENAVTMLRQHLTKAGDTAKGHTRLALAYLRLGEASKARTHCNQAKALDATDLDARWILGCCMAQLGEAEDALKEFRALLGEQPDYHPAFEELVRLRKAMGHEAWVQQALRREVGDFNNLERRATISETGTPKLTGPRVVAKQRIQCLLEAIGHNEEGVTALLGAMDRTADEGIRFQVWQAVLDRLRRASLNSVGPMLAEAGRNYSVGLGLQVLALAEHMEPSALLDALTVEERDLRSAAVRRHGPTQDIQLHRRRLDDEHREARAWQAQLLLAIGTHDSPATRALLLRWTREADPALADAARIARTMLCDEQAYAELHGPSTRRGAQHILEHLQSVASVRPAPKPFHVMKNDVEAVCHVCGSTGTSCNHILTGPELSICNNCISSIADNPMGHEENGANAVCMLTGQRSPHSTLYAKGRAIVSWTVLEHSRMLLEGLDAPDPEHT
jgi:tetratricopeptide (TPR) repeat protein